MLRVKGSRARLMQNRSGSWTLAYTEVMPASFSRDTGYRQVRGKRDDLIAHAKEIGVTSIFAPDLMGARSIDEVQVFYVLRDLEIVSSALHLSLPTQEQQ